MLLRKLMMSRKPSSSPSWKLLPTEIKVVGTPLATPTVYWISKLASMPAWSGSWRFWPPSKVWSVKVVPSRSGRRLLRNVCRSALLANCWMNPETARMLVFWVALVVGIPYRLCRHVGVTVELQLEGTSWREVKFPDSEILDGVEKVGIPPRGLLNLRMYQNKLILFKNVRSY